MFKYLLGILFLLAIIVYFIKKKYFSNSKTELATSVKTNLNSRYKMTNDQHLSQLNPEVKDRFTNLVKDIQDMGYVVVVTSSTRTYAEAVELKKQNPKNATPGFSSHEYGTAIDIVVYKNGKLIGKGDAFYKDWVASGIPKLAITKYGMRWGGDFPAYKDEVHFDYDNLYNTTKLRQYAIKEYGSLDKAPLTQLPLKSIV